MFEREYREMSFVPRWTIVRTIKPQNIAEHTFYVTLYAGQIADLIEWKGDRAALLDAALRHDLEETYMSDIPGPSKRKVVHDIDQYHEMTHTYNLDQFGDDFYKRGVVSDSECAAINSIIKVADLLDECFFLATEMQLGNKSLNNVMENSRLRLHRAIGDLPKTKAVALDVVSIVEDKITQHIRADSRVPTVP